MNWKFSCESKPKLLLPPEITFPQVLNYLNPEGNSFFILENENGYIQCGGSKKNCTIEFRKFLSEDEFEHFVFYNPLGSNDKFHFVMSGGSIFREKRHSFNFLKAARLFLCYYENREWPEGIAIEEITSEFK